MQIKNVWIRASKLGLAVWLMANAAPGKDINWPEFVSTSDLVWTNGIKADFYDGAFIGDGVQGAMVMRDTLDTNAVRLLMGHYNAITHHAIPHLEYCVSRVFAGNIIISPHGAAPSHTMRLHLWDGEASGTITTQTGKILWSAFCERTHNVFVVTVQGSGGEQDATARVREEWGITPCFYLNQKDPETYAAELPPKPEISRLGEINLVTQKMKTGGAHVVASQCVREPGQTRLFVAIGTAAAADVNLAAANAAKDAMSRVQAAVAKGGVALTISHRNWWHAYLQSSYLEIPDDPYWQKYWWRQIYKFGSASSESSDNIIDTQGPWLWDSGWAAVWWNLNVQLSYYPMFSANKLAAGKSLINGVNRIYQSGALQENARPNPGITIGRATTQDGRGAWGNEYGNMPWVLQCYWKYWRYSADDTIGRALFPMLKDCAAFLRSQLQPDTNGVLHMTPSRSPEYNDTLHPDANYALMSTRWALQTLLAMNEELKFNDPQTNEWRDTLEHLAPYPVDAHGLRIDADQGFDMSHRHYSHLLAIYPYHILTPEQGDQKRELITRSVNRWQDLKGGHAGYTYTGGCAMYATLGEGERALETLDHLKPLIKPNTMYWEGGGEVVETPLSAVESIDYLLLQSWGGVIRIFPAPPQRWKEMTFDNFRTEGAFLVSAAMRNGMVSGVKIHSEAGKTCVLQNPWPGRELTVTDGFGQTVKTMRAGKNFTFATATGGVYFVNPNE